MMEALAVTLPRVWMECCVSCLKAVHGSSSDGHGWYIVVEADVVCAPRGVVCVESGKKGAVADVIHAEVDETRVEVDVTRVEVEAHAVSKVNWRKNEDEVGVTVGVTVDVTEDVTEDVMEDGKNDERDDERDDSGFQEDLTKEVVHEHYEMTGREEDGNCGRNFQQVSGGSEGVGPMVIRDEEEEM
mmetsp:Transcript_86/g.207  ORF Transcript_86/g.207 Transcript_86/m.207 type:complete len:186 (-) Transcript_86:792-1349(-)